MTTNPTTPKRWRPRFSVRTLVVLVTLVCLYAACWGPTKTRGVADVARHVNGAEEEGLSTVEEKYAAAIRMLSKGGGWRPSATLPLVVGINETRPPFVNTNRAYYFWFFGYVVLLPQERDGLSKRTATSTISVRSLERDE